MLTMIMGINNMVRINVPEDSRRVGVICGSGNKR